MIVKFDRLVPVGEVNPNTNTPYINMEEQLREKIDNDVLYVVIDLGKTQLYIKETPAPVTKISVYDLPELIGAVRDFDDTTVSVEFIIEESADTYTPDKYKIGFVCVSEQDVDGNIYVIDLYSAVLFPIEEEEENSDSLEACTNS